MDPMLANWLAGSIAIIGSVLLQFGAQWVLLWLGALRRARLPQVGLRSPLFLVPVLLVVFVLIIGHVLQMAVWAGAYAALGELQGLANAVYFSMASYTTIGANHLDLTTAHRILGALEAGIGVMMFGWSTALLVSLFTNAERENAGR